ncbi:MAG: FecR family protein [Niabella sp.]|nr:MAG: FecR family protein [Niabella sp.]
MPYKQDIIRLLTDESFINYCKESSAKDIAFWENYLLKNPEEKETIERAKNSFLLLFSTLADADREEQLNILKQKLQASHNNDFDLQQKERENKILSIVVRFSAVAAILIVSFFILKKVYFNDKVNPVYFTTLMGERKTVKLPDGTLINLNAGTTLHTDDLFGKQHRNIYLEGEAFFDVAHNKELPFIVHTPSMDVRALGTSFNVKAYPTDKRTEAVLIKGSVKVTLNENNSREVILQPNEKIEWVSNRQLENGSNHQNKAETQKPKSEAQPQKVIATQAGVINEIAWKNNKLVFDDDSLGGIVPILERWYGVEIDIKDDTIRQYRYSGNFEKEDLNTVLEFLKESKPFNFKIDNNGNKKVTLSH